MKKFNTKTLIIGLLIIIGLFLIVFNTFGQNPNHTRILNPPTDLFSTVADDNDVSLFWTEPSPGNSTYLHWDSGENDDAFGNLIMPATLTFAAKYDPVHISSYDGWEVTKFRFYVVSPLPTLKLKIFTGPDASEVYSQNVQNFGFNRWFEVELTTPYIIDASTQLWIALEANMPEPGYVMGGDDGPGIDGYGNMYKIFGNWYHDYSLNWNLQAFIEPSDARSRETLLGYNVYRDNEKLNSDTWTSSSYVDENLLNGTYDYHVTAVYDDGESDPSNSVEVVINQPVIAYADSMALVDIYNQCNGPNWIINDNWLISPVNEWYGVVTNGTRVTKLWLHSRNLTGDIPESIGDLTALTTLELSSNPITSIPETIGNLVNLEIFWVGWTNIPSVPETIGNLVNLYQLHLGQISPPLTSLPSTFCNLESLEWLALGGNALTSLPVCFGNLTNLKSCFIWNNNLTELPEGFGGLESLEYLTLDNNQLTTLPESFGNLDRLSKLFIEGNQITHLPESFADLATIDSIHARFNQINALPLAIGNLDDLNFLQMSYNQITDLPESITDLASIEELYFDANLINAIPENIGDLTTLTVLGLIGNNIDVVPESIGNLGQLEILGLAHNNIEELPESFGTLNADSLYLNNNLLTELPAAMFGKTFDMLLTYNNYLQFGSIEPFVGNVLKEYVYSPQGMISIDNTISAPAGQPFSYTVEVSGENNLYFWYKNGTIISGQNTNTLQLANLSEDDEGEYKLRVTNTVAGALTLESNTMELLVEACVPWEFNITGQVHSIAIPGSANPNINGEPLLLGDWIGVFYLDDNNQELCGGATTWSGPFVGASITAYGDDPTTPEKDGFAVGETFIWKMFKCGDATEYPAVAGYNPEMQNQDQFVFMGVSGLTSLTNIACQEFELLAGWNDISTYLIPNDPSVEQMFSSVVDDLLLIRNLTQVYWPEAGINTIGDWDNTSGYAVNFTENVSLSICGNSLASKTLEIGEGWSYLPVPSECEVELTDVFGAFMDEIIIIQDLIGFEVYWPSQGIYTLSSLNPGSAYKIKTNTAVSVVFPECDGMVKTTHRSSNIQKTVLGELAMTPFTESIAIHKNATKNFAQGDLIAAYNQAGNICGMIEVSGYGQANALVLFGDDPTTTKVEGLMDEEAISFKLHKPETGEVFELHAEFDHSLEAYDGLFRNQSLAGILKFNMQSTALNELGNPEQIIYPNPAKGLVNIVIPSTITGTVEVAIINIQGEVILRNLTDSKTAMIDINSLSSGIYMVKLKTNNFVRIGKLVVK